MSRIWDLHSRSGEYHREDDTQTVITQVATAGMKMCTVEPETRTSQPRTGVTKAGIVFKVDVT